MPPSASVDRWRYREGRVIIGGSLTVLLIALLRLT